MKSIAVTEFKARCLRLLEDVARTGETLVVTKRGKILARVVPSVGDAKYPQDTLAGTVTVLKGDLTSPVVAPGSLNAELGIFLSQDAPDFHPRRAKRRARRS